jgi:hypothetical protein
MGCGLVGSSMEDNLIPVGRCVLGMVMGRLVEENPTASLIKVPGIKVWDIKVRAP